MERAERIESTERIGTEWNLPEWNGIDGMEWSEINECNGME